MKLILGSYSIYKSEQCINMKYNFIENKSSTPSQCPDEWNSLVCNISFLSIPEQGPH